MLLTTKGSIVSSSIFFGKIRQMISVLLKIDTGVLIDLK